MTQPKIVAEEVLLFDSSIFIAEIGLRSADASALKHYLYRRGTQLVVPHVAAEECKRHLVDRAINQKAHIQGNLAWLGRFLGRVGGWAAPSDETIGERAQELAVAADLGAVMLPETDSLLEQAKLRDGRQLPPSHLRSGLPDCKIWEHCLELLTRHNVVFVSKDKDFRGHSGSAELHPHLQAEAHEVGSGRRLTFHQNIESLLNELRSEIPRIPKETIFAFVYDALAMELRDMEAESGYLPMAKGSVRQTLLTTNDAKVIEVRLEIQDTWERLDCATAEFLLSGSCHYHLDSDNLTDLNASSVSLLETQPDGSARAVKGSYVSFSANISAGPPPVEPGPSILEVPPAK